MIRERANRLGIIYTFIFGVIFSLPAIYFVSKWSVLEVLSERIVFSWHYLDVFLPVLLVLSIYNGRFLGQKILLEKDDEGLFYCSQRLAFVSNFTHVIIFFIFLIYSLVIGSINTSDFGFGLFGLFMPGMFFYLLNGIPFLIGSFFMNAFLLTYIGVSFWKTLRNGLLGTLDFLAELFTNGLS